MHGSPDQKVKTNDSLGQNLLMSNSFCKNLMVDFLNRGKNKIYECANYWRNGSVKMGQMPIASDIQLTLLLSRYTLSCSGKQSKVSIEKIL